MDPYNLQRQPKARATEGAIFCKKIPADFYWSTGFTCGKNQSGYCLLLVKIHIEYQDQFGYWKHYTTQNHQPSAYITAKHRARSTGKRYRLVDEDGRVLDLLNP